MCSSLYNLFFLEDIMKNQKVVFFTDCHFWQEAKFKKFFKELLKKLGMKKLEFFTFDLPRDWEIKEGEIHFDYTQSIRVLEEEFEKAKTENPEALFIMDYIGSDVVCKEKMKIIKTAKNKDSFVLIFAENRGDKNKDLNCEISKLIKLRPFTKELIFMISSDQMIELLCGEYSHQMQKINERVFALQEDPEYQRRQFQKFKEFHRRHCCFSPETLAKRMTI